MFVLACKQFLRKIKISFSCKKVFPVGKCLMIQQQRWIFHTVMDRLFRTLEDKMATEWTLDQTLYEKGNSKGVFCRLFGRRSKDSRERLWQWTTEILLKQCKGV